MLSESQLASMRAAMAASLPDVCTIQSYTPAPDNQGGQERAWAALATGVRCRLNRTTKQIEVERAGKISSVVGFELIVPHGTALLAKHRVLIGGVTYEVIAIDGGGAERVELTAMVFRVT